MKRGEQVMSKNIKIVGTAPRIIHRAIELFQDARFKPRIVKSKRVYSRKGRNSDRANYGN
jgi:hypothetical protein